jgi:DNA-binding response OmpR family regulator
VNPLSASRPRILIAEDDPDTLTSLQWLLTNWGYQVVPARDGEEALEVLRSEDPPRLAILDWMMPGVDGLEVCRLARGLHPSQPPYLIMLTGREGRNARVAGLEGGADEYLTKPIDPAELRARLLAAWRVVDLQARLAERARQLEAGAALVVVGPEHPGLRRTLKLSVLAFTEVLLLQGVPRHLCSIVQTARELCLQALGESGQEGGDGEDSLGDGRPL